VHVQGYITVRDIWVEERHTGRTPEGIRVGDTKQQVLNAYGSRASVQPGPYVGEMIVVDGPLSGDWGYVFDMPSGGIVSTIYIANHAKIAAGGCT